MSVTRRAPDVTGRVGRPSCAHAAGRDSAGGSSRAAATLGARRPEHRRPGEPVTRSPLANSFLRPARNRGGGGELDPQARRSSRSGRAGAASASSPTTALRASWSRSPHPGWEHLGGAAAPAHVRSGRAARQRTWRGRPDLRGLRAPVSRSALERSPCLSRRSPSVATIAPIRLWSCRGRSSAQRRPCPGGQRRRRRLCELVLTRRDGPGLPRTDEVALRQRASSEPCPEALVLSRSRRPAEARAAVPRPGGRTGRSRCASRERRGRGRISCPGVRDGRLERRPAAGSAP